MVVYNLTVYLYKTGFRALIGVEVKEGVRGELNNPTSKITIP